jgi:hypothetical protein
VATLHSGSKSPIILPGGRRLRDETDHLSESEYGSHDSAEEINDRDLMLPGPGEYADLATSNPFSDSCSDSSSEKCSSSSQVIEDKEMRKSLSRDKGNRLTRFLGRATLTKSMVSTKGKAYESIEETLVKLKMEEDEAERALAADDDASSETSNKLDDKK